MRSAAVVAFIGFIAAVAMYCAQRRTVARGDAIAADLLESNQGLATIDCDKAIPIGMKGATFACKAHFKNGEDAVISLSMDRAGQIRMVGGAQRVKKTSDPWGD